MVDDLVNACDIEKIIVLLLRNLTLCQINISWFKFLQSKVDLPRVIKQIIPTKIIDNTE